MTAHFTNEEKSSKEKKNIEKPYTPNYVRHKRMFNPPLTSDNKNINKYKFNYNFETKSNGIIVPKEVKKINQIKMQNLFKVGNNNINKNQKNKNKMKPCSSRIEQIFGTQGNSPRNSSLVSITHHQSLKSSPFSYTGLYSTGLPSIVLRSISIIFIYDYLLV